MLLLLICATASGGIPCAIFWAKELRIVVLLFLSKSMTSPTPQANRTTLDTATIKENHLYLKYSFFSVESFCTRQHEEIIPIDRISSVEYKVGPKGGDHGWAILSTEKRDYLVNDETEFQCKEITSFGKKHSELRDDIIALLRPLGITITQVSSTSAPCF